MKKIKIWLIVVCLVFFIAPGIMFAQSNESKQSNNISVGYGEFEGAPFTFTVAAPIYSKRWRLSISEFTGRELFYDSGDIWSNDGYTWVPDTNIDLYKSIYYTVSISFLDDNNRVIVTEATKFFIPVSMNENKAPLFFFNGDTVIPSDFLYEGRNTEKLLAFIIEQSKTTFASSRILIRGHASFITTTKTEQREEQIGLLELSRNRALSVLDRLVAAGIDSTRIFYEAFGGTVAVSTQEDQRWKNRRVEVVFVSDIDNIDLSTNGNLSDTDTTVQIEPNYITEPDNTVLEKIVEDENVDPWPDINILGKGQLNPEHVLSYMLYKVPTRDTEYIDYLRRIIMYYITEAERERVNYDIAIAQMLLETDYLRFTGTVQRLQYNFAGIGTVNNKNEGNWFATESIGIRAHIQHLKGYATKNPLTSDLVDPRYPLLERVGLLGSAPLVSGLSGRWASDPHYSKKILIILRRMYNFSNALVDVGR